MVILIKFLFYTLTHPIDGFYEIRHHGKGSIGLSLLTVFFCGIAYCINKRYANFLVNPADTREVNSLLYVFTIFVLFFLFCIGNWSVTCLMNGEGRMQDIITATGYALLPIPLLFLPATLLSQIVTADEMIFYYLLINLSILWGVLLVILSNMVIHNYTLTKEINTLLLTVAAMIIILFIILLFYSMFRQMIGFVKSIYTELIFRV
ncbi:MAG: YIP1 family protein [Lachnospiraceae bacterium]|nr:YIP1 family protein [Lachnospiraceae bacterium]